MILCPKIGDRVCRFLVGMMRKPFGGKQEHVVKARMLTIGRYFVARLKTIFPGVAEEPGVHRNSTNSPLYLLCFAASNERGAPWP